MLQEALRNADAKNYLKISSTEDDASRGNIFGLTEERLGYKESKRRNIQQVITIQEFLTHILPVIIL